MMEHIFLESVLKHVENKEVTPDSQHSFIKGSEQADTAEDAPAHCIGDALGDFYRSLPTQIIVWFYVI